MSHKNTMTFIDLSVPINENTPVYPGDPKTKIEQAGVMKNDGYEDSLFSMSTHTGTHVDAPMHMVPGGIGLDKVSPENLTGRGVYINVETIGFDLKEIKTADIHEGDIVLFHTGMSSVYEEVEYYKTYPVITEEIANYLVEKKVRMVGVDMCSVDREPFTVHRILLKNNILIIENLTNLSLLEGRRFKIYAFPIKLQIDGAPARVIAEIIE